ncbi:MAG: hypothetical protein U1E45_16735 [Geminicoccaceae bacterium]
MRLLLLLSCLALAACASSGTAPQATDTSNVGAARQMLAAQSRGGPVPLVVAGPTGGRTASRVGIEAGRGVRGLAVRFVPMPPVAGQGRLVLWFDPPAATTSDVVCSRLNGSSVAEGTPSSLTAVWCVDDKPVAEVNGSIEGTGADQVDRLVWRSTSRLFPDDYQDTYGFNLFGNRVNFGGWFGL